MASAEEEEGDEQQQQKQKSSLPTPITVPESNLDRKTNSLNSLSLPSGEVLREIERKQEERAKVIRERRARSNEGGDVDGDDDERTRTRAAQTIQKNYRGYRERRALEGRGLSPSTRWLEALKDAKYNQLTTPQSRTERFSSQQTTRQRVRDRWAHVGQVAKHAGSDDTSDSELDAPSQAAERQKRKERKREREKYAQTMGIQYFLEMVDQKHRYGSNLRRYHEEWKKSDTKENFFYWLDNGEGKDLDLEDRPRERLDREQVRYLSREERKKYLVRIDAQGRFVWEKNGKPITTSPDFRDSIDGIVHESSDLPTWREVTTGEKPEPSREEESSDSSSTCTSISTGSQEEASKYANEEFHNAKGLSKLNHISVDALMNHLLRKTTKQNVWIFVTDTSNRLYVGIKQSGAFQHSSFLKGARVAAAGLIKIKRGQIRKLSPLSGHYAPPVHNFREFLKTLKEANADLSHLNVSRSYAIILGLEGYIRVKKKGQKAKRGVVEAFNPEEKKRREEEEKDNSQSAEKERQILAQQAKAERRNSKSWRLKKMMGMVEEDGEGEGEGEGKADGGGSQDSRPWSASSSKGVVQGASPTIEESLKPVPAR